MNVRERIEQLGKELLTLAGLQSDVEKRVAVTKKEIEELKAEVTQYGTEHD